mmetsp:Transcript_4866/g.7930  ORF Transcript_4866/g.7930 Transcript_4866/m.7930 type:complete len:776 (+) Transcript_4866:321-2648(+)
MDSYNKLKRGIRESRDYVSVPESVSKAWLQWYGGHTPIVREARELGILKRSIRLDLYPMIISLLQTTAEGEPERKSKRKLSFSSSSRLCDVRDELVKDYEPMKITRRVLGICLDEGSMVDAKDEYGYWFPAKIVRRFNKNNKDFVEINWQDPKYSDSKHNEVVNVRERHRFSHYHYMTDPHDKRGVQYAKREKVWARLRVVKKRDLDGDLPPWHLATINLIHSNKRQVRVKYNIREKTEYWFHSDSTELLSCSITKKKPAHDFGERPDKLFDEITEEKVYSPREIVRLWLPHRRYGWELAKEEDHMFKSLAELKLTELLLERRKRSNGKWVRVVEKHDWRDLERGDLVDAKDTMKKWYEAEVIECRSEDNTVFVHYVGFSKKWDEWLNINSSRLAKHGTMTVQKYDSNTPPMVRGGVGLVNLGNTCYMNSIVQCLSNCADFTEYFLDQSYLQDLPQLLSSSAARGGGMMATTLAELLQRLWNSQTSVFPPRALKKMIGKANPDFKGSRQQDASELLVLLFDRLSSDLKRPPAANDAAAAVANNKIEDIGKKEGKEGKEKKDCPVKQEKEKSSYWESYRKKNDSIITDLMTYVEQQTTMCLTCNKTHIINTASQVLQLSIPPSSFWSSTVSLKDCFELYKKKEVLEGLTCERCNRKQKKVKYTRIAHLPDILVITLNRFRMGYYSGQKVSTYVEFPLHELKLDGVIENDELKGINYDLVAVSNHIGRTNKAGHYTAYAKSPINKKWYKFDDTRVNEVRRDYVVTDKAYILFYKRRR